jgi:hypothetical protein
MESLDQLDQQDRREIKDLLALVAHLETWDLEVPKVMLVTLAHQDFLAHQVIVVQKVFLVMWDLQGRRVSVDLLALRVTLEQSEPLDEWVSRAQKVTRVTQVHLEELAQWVQRV